MKKTLLTLALTLSSLALASTWEIDPSHTSANFGVRHMMISTVNGKLGAVAGAVELDEKDVTKSSVAVTIDVKGLETQNQKRNDHLRSKEFFDVEKFPTVTFKSTKFEKAGDKLKVTGDLTIHGVTKPVTLDAELSAEVANPFTKALTRAVAASTTVSRKDYGLTWNVPLGSTGVLVGDEVKITIEAEVTKK